MDKQKHTSGFKVPESYFETFEEKLFTKIAEEQLPNQSGFSVPPGYFDGLEDTLAQHPDIAPKHTKVRSLFAKSNLKYAVAVAAAVVLAVVLLNKNNATVLDMNSVDYLAIENYINEGELDFDLYDVSNLLSENNSETLNYGTENISEENLESYLLETVDESILLDE
ncbi:hypothetical protein [Marixanthomonas spongiae]|uniref:Uncharacterized protein n=1 Tax=Marixanthomonas spongiae TaxID=2174845 RepID=A0A2U0I0S3_9FLAO|nr:hypothetical protein [Marixanthomonas spongiae]PVW14705.1 hypothetical protein DDV96_09315 [Marixanthomonas spongiae]